MNTTHITSSYKEMRTQSSSIASVEQYLKITNVAVTDEMILREVTYISEKYFNIKISDIIDKQGKDVRFILICYVRYLIIDKQIDWKLLQPIFKDKYTSHIDFYAFSVTPQSEFARKKYIEFSQYVNSRLSEMNL